MPRDIPNTPLLHIWAKSEPYMSIITHSICVGVCAREYLTSPSNKKILTLLSERFSQPEEGVVNIVSYLCSVHDIGKIHPAFQSKDTTLYDTLKQITPSSFIGITSINRPEKFRHEYYSAKIMERVWCKNGIVPDVAAVFASILSLHHQKPKDRSSYVPTGNSDWELWQSQLNEMMSGTFLKNTSLVMPSHVDSTCMLLTSILVLMDWVASSDLFMDAEHMSHNDMVSRAKYAMKLFDLIGESLYPTVKSFENLFPHIKTPRPLQSTCDALDPSASLSIIEAPMGEGKTEAALYLASKLCNSRNARGIYMALPSQATSNQMYGRVNEMLSSLSANQARLLHGTAFLRKESYHHNIVSEDQKVAEKWTRPSRMGLLGTNAVGTVDQAMAAVLFAKFSMLRLAGLSNKVLIIDEIHAYDMYMSQIIETLLKWCYETDIPVILLSATMQMEQKERYLTCFKANTCTTQISSAYPLITQVCSSSDINQISIKASTSNKYIFTPIKDAYNAEIIAEHSLQSVKGGGCVAVIMNTVARAQEVHKALLQAADNDTLVLLFHSRYTVKNRADIERQCVDLFGKDRINRPTKAILVATQVVEQSIDLDFDGMITELAPIDLLLQRAGRLHRHKNNSRPRLLSEPEVKVIVPNENNFDLETKYGSSGYVYDPFLLYNTEQHIGSGLTVCVPEDIRDTIETVYKTITPENKTAWMNKTFKDTQETASAKGNTWPAPTENMFFPMQMPVYYTVIDPDDGFDATSEATTRLGNGCVRIAFCEPSVFDEIQERHEVDPLQVENIYLNSASVRIREKELISCDNAYKVENGKLTDVWLLRGIDQVDLNTKIVYNNNVVGIRMEAKNEQL